MSKIALKLAAIIIGLGCATALQAQVVTGTVKDGNGEPVMGAFVLVQGTNTGTTTDIDGKYSLNVPDASKNILEISMIGMTTVTVPVGGRAVVDATLTEDTTFLDEVVVVGYATVKRRDLLGSVSSVSADKLTEQPVTTVSQALTGKMAGVSVVTTEGDPDADIKIRVRGGSSITQDNSPLYIVDGFPVESINDISSSEIASIDVLKDAFSTAIYGSRGANGVVIVTTKGGEKGRKVSVNLNSYFGMKKMANAEAIQPMDAENYVKFQYELAKIRDNVSDVYAPFFGNFDDIDMYMGQKTNDWVGMVFGGTGYSSNTDASVSGCGDGYNWTLGFAHLQDDAIMSGSSYARNNVNFKGRFDTSKKTWVDVNLRFSRTNVRGSGANSINDTGTNSGNGRLKHCVSFAPIPISNATAGMEEEEDYGDNAPPLLSVADNDSKKVRTTWNANAAFNWEIVKNLKLKVEGGFEDYREASDRFYGMTTYYVYNSNRPGPANQHKEVFKTKYRNTNTLNYDFSDLFAGDAHSLNILVGEELTYTKSNSLLAELINFPSFYTAQNAWNFMASGTPLASENTYSPDNVLLSFFGRINYDYKHRYSAAVTFRADGSSKFGPRNRWGYFPSAAVSWTVSNEPWMKATSGWLDQLKFRYSFGSAGNNNIPSGQILKEYSAKSTSPADMLSLGDGNTYWMAGKIMNNPDLKWETTYTHNIGMDFSFLKGRINGSVEVYQNDTKDLLINFPITGSGYDSQYRNLGSTRNRGIELTLNMPIVQTKNVSLNLGGNIAYNQNRVTDLGGLDSIMAETRWASSEIGNDYIVELDKPMGNMYGYFSDGRYEVSDFTYTGGKWVLNEGVVDCSSVIGSQYMRPGAMKLKDITGDGKVTVADRDVIGNASPDFTGGFYLTGYLYGFDFSTNFNFMIGNQVYNANKVEFTSSRKFYNRNLINMMDVNKRWTNIDWNTGEFIEDPEALAAANAGTTMWNPCVSQAVFSDWAVEDASFLRLQSATIGYTIPAKVTEKIHLRKVRVYATGTNLFCLTNYSGYDPEVDTRRATPLTPGVDYSAYPKSIGCVFGINLTF